MSVKKNAEYLRGIKENDFTILEKIYKESLPEVIKYIKRNSGTTDDAKDVFQEGILVIFDKVKEGKLELTTSFHVFLFIVCKRIWLKKLKKRGNKEVTLEENLEFGYEINYEERFLKTQKWNLFNQKFEELAEECRKVLKLLFNGFSGKEIAEAMGYTEEYAKRKKYKCKLSLADLIKKDSTYQNLIE
jgi:RNA polymerase sigma factor (sigma-70 family)